MTGFPLIMNELAYAHGGPVATAVIRSMPEDFIVQERLGFVADGAGEHVLLNITKRGENTQAVADHLAQFCQVDKHAVGFAGMKDRHALTTQWFSVNLSAKAEPDWQQFNNDSMRVNEVCRHRKKLPRGALQGNDFVITIRSISGEQFAIEDRVDKIRHHGIPNYFGEQRFGHDNMARAQAMFAGKRVRRQQRSLYISATRSYLFNRILSRRVHDGSWNEYLPGDVLMLDGSHSLFSLESAQQTEADGHELASTKQRLADNDIHISGPLWGSGGFTASTEAEAIERQTLAANPELCHGLEQAGLKLQRRALRVLPRRLELQTESDAIKLSFFLPAGSYATSLLREIIQW